MTAIALCRSSTATWATMGNYPGHGEKFRKTSDIVGLPESFIVGPNVSAQEYEAWLATTERYWRERMTKYRITINETRVVTVTKKEYKILSQTGNEEDDGPRYGYVEYETEEEQHGNILDLHLDHLNLQEIIDAAMRQSS